MEDTHKRFDEWTPVDCNQCGKYWDSSCDGVKCRTNSDKGVQGPTRLCNSFLPTRSILIPAQIKALQWAVRCLAFIMACFGISFIVHILIHIFGG